MNAFIERKTLVYIANTGSSVFDSQVVSLLTQLSTLGFFSRILLLAGVKKGKHWNSEMKRLQNDKYEVVLFRQYPNYFFYEHLQKRELSFILARIVQDETIIHIRGDFYTKSIYRIIKKNGWTKVRIVTDIRGIGEAEVRLYLKREYNLLKYWLKINQSKRKLNDAIIYSDMISCISRSLSEQISAGNRTDNKKVTVNNCLAGDEFKYSVEKRQQYRSKLGLKEGDILCVFVTGSINFYENARELTNSLIENGCTFLNLSKTSIRGAKNMFVAYNEVPNYLCASDIGIIWRNNDIVNNTSSPVKVSEYLCCGLPIIANNSIHVLNDFISETGFGRIISRPEDINIGMLKAMMGMDRNHISKIACQRFSVEVIAKNYLTEYQKLIV